jgi:hypothetical protein
MPPTSSPPDVVVWVGAGLAVYGAVLSTYNALLGRSREARERERAEREREREQRSVRVEVNLAVITDPPERRLVITARCEGPRPVTISGHDVILASGERVFVRHDGTSGQPLPAKLNDGEEVDILIPIEALRRVQTETGHRIQRARVHGSGGEWLSEGFPDLE